MDSDEDCKNILRRLTETLNQQTPTPSGLNTQNLLADYEAVEEARSVMESWNIVEEGSSLFKSGVESKVPAWRKNLLNKPAQKSPQKTRLEKVEEEERVLDREEEKEAINLEDDIRLGLDIVEQYRKNAQKFKKESEKFKKISNEGKEEVPKAPPKELARHEQPYFRMEIRHQERLEKRAALKVQKHNVKKSEIAVQNVPPNRTQSRIQSLREKRQMVEREAQDLAEMSKKVKDEVEKEVAELKAFDKAQKQLEVERKRKEEYEREMQRLLAERAKSIKDKKKYQLNKLTEILDLKFKRARLRILRRTWHSMSSFSAYVKMRLVKAGCSRRFSMLCKCFSGIANYAREERIKRAEEEYLKEKKIQEAMKKRANELYETHLHKLGFRSLKLYVAISVRERQEEEREEKRKKRLQDFFETVQSKIDESRMLEEQRKKQSQEAQFQEVKDPVLFDESSLSPIKDCVESIPAEIQKLRSPESLKTITEEMCETEREIKAIASPGQRYQNLIEQEEEEKEPVKEQKTENKTKVSKIVLEMEKREAERKKKRMELEERYKEREAQKKREIEEQKKKQEEDAKRQKQQKLREARQKKQAELKKKEEKREARLKEKERENEATLYYLRQLQRRAVKGLKGLLFILRVKEAKAGEKLRKSILA